MDKKKAVRYMLALSNVHTLCYTYTRHNPTMVDDDLRIISDLIGLFANALVGDEIDDFDTEPPEPEPDLIDADELVNPYVLAGMSATSVTIVSSSTGLPDDQAKLQFNASEAGALLDIIVNDGPTETITAAYVKRVRNHLHIGETLHSNGDRILVWHTFVADSYPDSWIDAFTENVVVKPSYKAES